MTIVRFEPEMVDSGQAWLGKIPRSWSLSRAGSIFRERREKVSDKDFPALSVTKKGIVPQLDNAAKTDDNDNRKKVVSGDYVINSRSDRKGSSGLSKLTGSVSLINTVATPIGLDPYYCHHLLRSVSFQEEYYRWGRGIVADLWTTNFSDFKNIKLPVPPIIEQRQIAAYLNRETTKIDQLIAKQQKLINLLHENRQAVITRAVTKGLDPNVKMKDSGVERLGQVPVHWKVRPIKQLCKIGNGSTPKKDNLEYWHEGSFPWLNSSCVNKEEVISASHFVTIKALIECHLPKVSAPAVLVGITGQGKTRGLATTLQIDATINQHIAFLKPFSAELSISFLRRFMDASYGWLRFDSEGAGSTKGAITCMQLGNLRISLPPKEEQIQINMMLQDRLASIELLIEKANVSVELLRQRRSAMITAAVTGKIDVRGLVTDEEVAALDADPVLETTEEDFESEVAEADYITEEE